MNKLTTAVLTIALIGASYSPTVFARVTPSDKIHEAVVYFYDKAEDSETQWGRGTGVVVKKFKDGSCWILTAAHVVTEDASVGGSIDEECLKMFVKFTDGTTQEVTFVKTGARSEDLALYRCKVCPVEPVKIAAEDVVPGELLYLQGAPHRPEGTRNYEFKSSPLTWSEEVFGDGDCWTGESGTAILNASGELVTILTGGWRMVKNQDGTHQYRGHPKNPFCQSVRVYPIVGMSNTEVIRDFLGMSKEDASDVAPVCNFTEYKRGQIDGKDGVRRLVLLSAEWCGPCQALKETVKGILPELAAAGIQEVVYVDCDKFPEMRERFSVRSYPTLLVITNGNVELRRSGNSGKEQILKWCEK